MRIISTYEWESEIHYPDGRVEPYKQTKSILHCKEVHAISGAPKYVSIIMMDDSVITPVKKSAISIYDGSIKRVKTSDPVFNPKTISLSSKNRWQ